MKIGKIVVDNVSVWKNRTVKLSRRGIRCTCEGFSTFGIDWYHLGHSLPAGWVAEGAAGVGAQREHHLAGARLDAELDCRFFVELLPGRNLQEDGCDVWKTKTDAPKEKGEKKLR